jgi:23S rRNA-/tRNA-specific pseudouridylate synthase
MIINIILLCNRGEIKVDQPIFKRDSNQGLQIVDPKGKPATTLFNRISTDGTTSIVKCKYCTENPIYQYIR